MDGFIEMNFAGGSEFFSFLFVSFWISVDIQKMTSSARRNKSFLGCSPEENEGSLSLHGPRGVERCSILLGQ